MDLMDKTSMIELIPICNFFLLIVTGAIPTSYKGHNAVYKCSLCGQNYRQDRNHECKGNS